MPTRLLTRLLQPRAVAVGRTGVGLTMLARPQLVPGLLGVSDTAQVEWVVQMLGAREVALGVGTLVGRSDRRTWLLAGAFSDAVDAAAVAAALGRGRVSKVPAAALIGVACLAAGTQVAGLRRR